MNDSSLDLVFPALGAKPVVCRFDGGEVTSDAGLLLVAQADRRLGLTRGLAEQIVDRREPAKIVHRMVDLLRERVFAIAAGYEDANDLDTLCTDPALLLSCERRIGDALASQPTISRLENQVDQKDLLCLGLALAETVVSQLPKNTQSVILDVDATDDPCHGQQEFEFFNGYYDEHCYVPLYLYVTAQDGTQRLMAALLRPGNASSKVGLFGLLRRAIGLLRERLPRVRITLRADSGFGDGEVFDFCEAYDVAYTLGLKSNPRLRTETAALEQRVVACVQQRGMDAQAFTTFEYRAHCWSQARRVVAKVETVRGQLNIRFVVSSRRGQAPAGVYRFYCHRGDLENRIKEMKNDLCAGRTSCHRFLANQFRLLLHTAAFVLMGRLQELLAGTRLQTAQAGTLRLRLVKIGARVQQSHRRVWLHLPTSCPAQDLWRHLYGKLVAGVT